MNRPIQAPVYRRILTVLTCCMVSLLAAGCGAGQTETIAPAGTDPVTESTAAEEVTSEETTEQTTVQETTKITETAAAAETSAEDAVLSEMAIDMTKRAMTALKEQDTDSILEYTNFPELYYLTTGKDPDENMDDIRARMEEGYPKENETGFNFFKAFDGTFTISRVRHSPELVKKFEDHVVKVLEEAEEGSSSRLENCPIEDVITVYGSMVYDDGNGDNGMVFLLKMNGVWKFDAVYSFSMEMSHEWEDMKDAG